MQENNLASHVIVLLAQLRMARIIPQFIRCLCVLSIAPVSTKTQTLDDQIELFLHERANGPHLNFF